MREIDLEKQGITIPFVSWSDQFPRPCVVTEFYVPMWPSFLFVLFWNLFFILFYWGGCLV